MKKIKYTAVLFFASFLSISMSGCSEKEELSANSDQGIEITGISLSMEGRGSETGTGTVTRATLIEGFSVNRDADPTNGLNVRSGWTMEFTLYYKKDKNTPEEKYNDGSFTDSYDGKATSKPTETKRFPNYKKQNAEAFLYPATWNIATDVPALDQNSTDKLLVQDVLTRAKALIEVAHTPKIEFTHKHAMLNFVIKDIVASDIAADGVKVKIGNNPYTPYKVTTGATATDIEYMVILPEGTTDNPVVEIKTNGANDSSPITYQQTINILKTSGATLGSNKCYCFTLQGVELKISPVTVLNWVTGASIPGEYIAVTAYPTFKAKDHPNKTYYFYYENKLVDKDTNPLLQKIEFNQNGECTIKPDGRVLTHIFKDKDTTPTVDNALKSPVILGSMIIDLNDKINALP